MAAGAPPQPDGGAAHFDGESDSVYYVHRCAPLRCSVAFATRTFRRSARLVSSPRPYPSPLLTLSLLRPAPVQRVQSDGVGSARRRRGSC
jgi:hypothetical protein